MKLVSLATILFSLACCEAFSSPSRVQRVNENAVSFLQTRTSTKKITFKHPPLLSLWNTATLWWMLVPAAAFAVSGGGLDYANLDISGQDFSNANYNGKDFTQVIAKGTNFNKSQLQGCRFYKAYLVNTNFDDADVRGASLEDTSMDGATLRNTMAAGAYFSASILDAKDLTNADFTDAQFPMKTLSQLCLREDVTGLTRESLMCP